MQAIQVNSDLINNSNVFILYTEETFLAHRVVMLACHSFKEGQGFHYYPMPYISSYLCTGETTDMTVADEDLPLLIKELVQQVNSTI